MNYYKTSLILCLFFILNSCSYLVVVLSPSKQRIESERTMIPKKEDFMYKKIINKNVTYFDTIVSLTAIEESYPYYPNKISIVFFESGQYYRVAVYSLNDGDKVFHEFEHPGSSGYYYIENDSIYMENFGISGLGHGYYYYQAKLDSSLNIKLDNDNWYYREPMRKKKYKLTPKNAEIETFNLTYQFDSLTIFNVIPNW